MEKKTPVLKTFETEGDLITPAEYFENLKLAATHLYGTVSKGIIECGDEKGVKIIPRPSLLDYEGEPEPVDCNLSSAWKTFNRGRECKLSPLTKLKAVKSKISLPNKYGKFELYQFLPPASEKCPKEVPPNFQSTLFVLKFYMPFLAGCRASRIKIMQEIHVLGHQSLQQVLSVLKCNIDYCGLQDVSDDIGKQPLGAIEDVRKAQYPSSFFYINNTFYNYRHHFTDLSEDLRKWLADNGVKTKSGKMDTYWKDIPLQTGKPYVYQHQGECEHIFVVSDIRFISNLDLNGRSDYPIVSAISTAMVRHCMMCGHSYSRWLVMNCLKLTISRAYLCHRCLLSYCYIDGRKTCDFQVYHYVDPALVL